ncbi:hypothetical protein LG198_07800 [Methylobacillus arboreus]|uniref:hypothetical protein n=1 Tax=Methylobacillus arboreus TaxID=755170 RepID=UPI001E289D97|nr:hypothetical protein [Methylobacillus arboreus]MCB5190625.1 hypothetical protein [Methylobacillus arboreus]
MKLQPRQWLMVLGLLATLALVFSIEDEEDAELMPSARPKANVALKQPASKPAGESRQHYLDWGLLQGRSAGANSHAAQADLFKPQRWYVPPPKTAVELAPPLPVAPQPGFAYIGKLEDGPQGTVILLASASRLYSVGVGENVDQSWRLDREDDNSLYLTYLPLNLPKTLLKKSRLAASTNPASHLPGGPDDLQGNL